MPESGCKTLTVDSFGFTLYCVLGLMSVTEREKSMDIKQVIATLNQMQDDAVVERYAIGGAVGATFYLEPVTTLDVDIFVALKAVPGTQIVSPKPIYDYLTARGCSIEGEYVIISGWPVQFLPPNSPLVEEALAHAVAKDVEGTPVHVFSAEHLAGIALQTGRAKDKARLLQFVESGILDTTRFQSLLVHHGLIDRWQQFERQFFGDKL